MVRQFKRPWVLVSSHETSASCWELAVPRSSVEYRDECGPGSVSVSAGMSCAQVVAGKLGKALAFKKLYKYNAPPWGRTASGVAPDIPGGIIPPGITIPPGIMKM